MVKKITYTEALDIIRTYEADKLHEFLDLVQELNFCMAWYVDMYPDLNITGNDVREEMTIYAVQLIESNYQYQIDTHYISFEEVVHNQVKLWLFKNLVKDKYPRCYEKAFGKDF